MAEVELGTARFGIAKTEDEQEKLIAESVDLPDEGWAIYLGEYKAQEFDQTVRIERQGNQLSFHYHDGMGRLLFTTHALPMGNHHFKTLEIIQTFEFIVVNGQVTQVVRSESQSTYHFQKIE